MTNLTNLLAKFNKLAEERRLAGPKLGMSDEMLDLELALCDVNPNLDFGSNPLPEYLTKAERFELMTELVKFPKVTPVATNVASDEWDF